MNKTKANRADLLKKVWEVLQETTDNPSDELIAIGNALVAIGEALKGIDAPTVRATLLAVKNLLGGEEER